jgi:hypothetical protein
MAVATVFEWTNRVGVMSVSSMASGLRNTAYGVYGPMGDWGKNAVLV